ncbi:MAG: PfkB family carbohydrate kinase [Phycisphaerae bacterium]
MSTDLAAVVARFAERRVLLVGDFMLDRYVFGDAERISPEAPVPVLRVVERQDRVGGAGSVALNVVALGARVHCCGVLGADAFGERVAALLRAAGAAVDGLLRVNDRPTITKTRLVGLAEHRHRQQILRVDDELVRPLGAADHDALVAGVRAALPHADVVCLEDYAKGVLTPALCGLVIDLARQHGKPVLVDPPRDRHWDKYRGATLMTPNRAELEIGVGRPLAEDELDSAAAELARRLALDGLVVTLGRDGARLVRADGGVQRFATRPRAVYDNTGAGDAVLAMMAVALAAGATWEQAVPLANIAGGLEVGKFGCVPITRDEVLAELNAGHESSTRGKVRSASEVVAELTARRQRGEKVVFTNGCFDILHPGHVDLLERAKSLGSLLVVGINSDASVRQQSKGDDRPIRRQEDRARMLAALMCVDFVVVFDEPDPVRLVEQLAPDVLVKGGDWAHWVAGRECVEARGGQVVLLKLVEGYSTTSELERIRAATAGTPAPAPR